jgi:hypothetical protein
MSTGAKCLMQLDFLTSACYFQRTGRGVNLFFCSTLFVLKSLMLFLSKRSLRGTTYR